MDTSDIIISIFVLVVFGLLILIGLTIHDAPITEEYNRLNRIDYLTHMNSNMSGVEKIKIATEICEKQYSWNSEYTRRSLSPLWKLESDRIPVCVDELIKGEG